MDLLNKLTIKNLKLNKKRTVVTIIGIILSVALITAVATMYSSGIDSLINYEKYQMGDFHIKYEDVPSFEIINFKNNRKIKDVYITQNVGYSKIDSKNEYKPYAYIKAFTKGSLENLSVKLVEGRLPENNNEIVIPTHLKTNGRIFWNVGDIITLDVGKRVDSEGYELNQNNPYNPDDSTKVKSDVITGEIESVANTKASDEDIVETTTKTYKIVGIIERVAKNTESYSAPGYTFITYLSDNDISGTVDIYARYTKEGLKDYYKVTANILGVNEELFEKENKGDEELSEAEQMQYIKEMEKAKYQIDANNYLIGLETDSIGSSGAQGLGSVVIVICIIIVVTSVFCIKNSFDISITEKIKQYGMIRSIGATKKQIKRNVFYEASILGLIGIPLGILLGLLASFILIIISNYLLESMLTEGLRLIFSFSYIPTIVAIILGIVTIYFSAFRSAKKAAKVSPIDSIRNSSNIKIKSKKIKSPKLIKRLFGIGGEISFKNLKRNKKKYRTTVISIIVSVFVFIGLSSFMNMAFDTVDNELKISDYNILVSSQEFNNSSYEKYIETTKLDNIEDYTILRQAGFNIKDVKYNKTYYEWLNWSESNIEENKDTYISIMVLGKEQYNKYISSLGLKYDEIKDKGILYDNCMVSRYDEEKDKYIPKEMRIFNYNVGDKFSGDFTETDETYEFQIGAIAKEQPFGLKNIDAIKLIISDELYDRIAVTKNIEILYKSNNADKLQDDIDELLKGENYYLDNMEEYVRMMNNLFLLVGIFLYGFIAVISLIGITNIFNTITTNMELRRQEFAMLKSVGMTKKEFSRMIRLESTFIGIKSLFFGIPIGIGISYLIYHFLSEDSGMAYKLPIASIIITIVAVYLLIASLMRYSMNKINKQNTIETIRNENI